MLLTAISLLLCASLSLQKKEYHGSVELVQIVTKDGETNNELDEMILKQVKTLLSRNISQVQKAVQMKDFLDKKTGFETQIFFDEFNDCTSQKCVYSYHFIVGFEDGHAQYLTVNARMIPVTAR